MAHESIPAGSDGEPARNPRSPSGYARTGLCPEAVRATHLGCSHTMARYVLRDALERLPDADARVLLAELHDLEQAISLLDHRRYDAEGRRADARASGSAAAATAEDEIAALVAEHRVCTVRAARLRDDVLRRLDQELALLDGVPS